MAKTLNIDICAWRIELGAYSLLITICVRRTWAQIIHSVACWIPYSSQFMVFQVLDREAWYFGLLSQHRSCPSFKRIRGSLLPCKFNYALIILLFLFTGRKFFSKITSLRRKNYSCLIPCRKKPHVLQFCLCIFFSINVFHPLIHLISPFNDLNLVVQTWMMPIRLHDARGPYLSTNFWWY